MKQHKYVLITINYLIQWAKVMTLTQVNKNYSFSRGTKFNH